MRRSFDEITIEIIRHGSGDDLDEFYWITPPDSDEFDPDAVADEFYALFSHDTETDWMHDGFTIRETRSRYEHGASGATWHLLIDAANTVPKEVLGFGLAIALENLRRRFGMRDPGPIDRDRALNSARWAITRANKDLSLGSLGEPVAEGADARKSYWTFTFRPGDGMEYAAEVGWNSSLPSAVHVERRALDPSRRHTIEPGSRVRSHDLTGVWVVVDISEDVAVLRRPDDPELMHPEARPLTELRLTQD